MKMKNETLKFYEFKDDYNKIHQIHFLISLLISKKEILAKMFSREPTVAQVAFFTTMRIVMAMRVLK